MNVDMKPPSGVAGLDPRKRASAEVGRRNVELAAEAIGRKSQQLPASLPEVQRYVNLKTVSPGNWWTV